MIAMSLRNVSSLQRVALLFLAFSVLCGQSEENECLKDGRRVDGSCSSFSATLKYSNTFSATLGTTDDSFSGDVDVEIKFGDCKFTVEIFNRGGILMKVAGVGGAFASPLKFENSGTSLVSTKTRDVLCSGLCSGSCTTPFSWNAKSSSSKIYLNFDAPATLVDPHGSKDLDVLTIVMIIIWSIILVVVLICVVALIIYCCKCKKSKNQKAKPDEAKQTIQATNPIKKIDLQEKKLASKEKTREEKTEGDEKAPAKPAGFITSKDLLSPPKIRKNKAEFITSQDLKSPTREKQKSSSLQKEEQAPKQIPAPQIKKRTGKSTEATLERVLTTREDEKLAAKEAAKDRAKRIDRDFVTLERVLTTHEEEKLAAKEAMLRAQAKKKTKTTSRDDATIVE